MTSFDGGRWNDKDPEQREAYRKWADLQRRAIKFYQYRKCYPKRDQIMPIKARKTYGEWFKGKFGEDVRSYHEKIKAWSDGKD